MALSPPSASASTDRAPVPPYAIGEHNFQGPAGPPGMVWRGVWSAITAYVVNDAVQYGGSSWIAVAANTNSAPSLVNPAWNLLAQAGSGGGGAVSLVDELLVSDPYTSAVMSLTYVTGSVTREDWNRLVGGALLKRTDFTYVGSNVTQIRVQTFDIDGTTLTGQTTETISYTGSTVTGTSKTRDI